MVACILIELMWGNMHLTLVYLGKLKKKEYNVMCKHDAISGELATTSRMDGTLQHIFVTL